MTKFLLTLASTSERTSRSFGNFIDSLEDMFDMISQPGNTKPSYNLALYTGMCLIFATIATIPLIFFQKGQIVLFFNGLNMPWLDQFFKYGTHLGDGRFFAAVAIGVILWKRKYWLAFVVTGALHALIVQLGKRVIFPDSPRPTAYFGEEAFLHFVEGVKVHSQHSFPSGHTATGFALAAIILFLFPKKRLFLPMMALAFTVGISRMYLLQHFYIDVATGAFIGVITAFWGWKAHRKWMA